MAFERHQPSVDLRAFLDPLKPGDYFDCGPARLYGIDEALESEAHRRGRAVGDDQFQLVATDGGLIFCRASIMFAIAARWKDLTIGRPEGGTRPGEATLAISWPTHGDLTFTVSRRLGSNVFRRWLQLQAQATRRSQVEQDRNGHTCPDDTETADETETEAAPETDGGAETGTDGEQVIDLRGGDVSAGEGIADQAMTVNADRATIADPVDNETDATSDPLATIDAAVVDDWVDDRVPGAPGATSTPAPVGSAPVDGGMAIEAIPTAGVTSPSSIRFEARRTTRNGRSRVDSPDDPNATRFMSRTADGTDIYPGDPGGRPTVGSSRFADPIVRPGTGGDHDHLRSGPLGLPVPEIDGARLHAAEPGEPPAGSRLDIRSTLLAGRRESEWVEMLRERQVLILGLATVVALGLIALLGFLSGGRNAANETAADVSVTAEVGADTGAVPADDEEAAAPAAGSSTTIVDPAGDATGTAPVDSTIPTLRVSSTSVQICHSNYGGCVPVAADVDCEGDGDGPAFQSSPVAVFGDDVYDLDTDDDRQACESGQPRTEQTAADG